MMVDEQTVTVGIFWAVGKSGSPELIFDREIYPKEGKYFINYSKSHSEMWEKLAAGQFGGKYLGYGCYYFPRGRVLYSCETKKTRVFADQKIIDKISDFLPLLTEKFSLTDFELLTDEHYQSRYKNL